MDSLFSIIYYKRYLFNFKEDSFWLCCSRTQTKPRKDWKEYLKKAAENYTGNQDIIDEITRIKDIVDYSSYFRKELSISALAEIQSGKEESQVLAILKEIE